MFFMEFIDKFKKYSEIIGLGLLTSSLYSFLSWIFRPRFLEEKGEIVKSEIQKLDISRPGQSVDLIYHYSIGIIIIILAIIIINKFLSENRKWIGRFLVFILFIIVFLVFNFFSPLGKVDSLQEISGHMPQNDWYAYLFVRPILQGDIWLQRPFPLQPDQNGEWRAGAYFGGISGEKFEILLIASKKRLDPNLFPSVGKYRYGMIPQKSKRYYRLVRLR